MSRGPWRPIRYRARQFLASLSAQVKPEEANRFAHILSPAAQRLFERQSAADQRHALAVYRVLQAQGETDERLLAAALLHDVGKVGARLGPLLRATVVLLERCTLRLAERLGREVPPGGETPAWRRPFVRHARHAQAGAHSARASGCSELTVGLIARHHEPLTAARGPEDCLLAALQRADDAC